MHKKYYIDTLENGKITLVKVLNEYGDIKEAENDLFNLISDDIKESDLLLQFSLKDPL